MANRGFENPCEVIVKDHEGLVYLAAKNRIRSVHVQ